MKRELGNIHRAGRSEKSEEEEWNDSRRIGTRLTVAARANLQSRGEEAGRYECRMEAAALLSVRPRQGPPFHTYVTVGLLIIYYHCRPWSPASRQLHLRTQGIISRQDPSPLALPPFLHPQSTVILSLGGGTQPFSEN